MRRGNLNVFLSRLCLVTLVMLTFSCSEDKNNDLKEDLMEEGVVFEGPENGKTYSEAQTSLTMLWEGHSLSFSTRYDWPTKFYISNVTDGKGDKVAVYDCQLTSVKGGGLNAVVLDFSKVGVTQTKNEQTGDFEIVYGDFEITIPMGMVESASVEFNPEQTIRFKQAKPDSAE